MVHGKGLVGGRCGERLQFVVTAVGERGQKVDSEETRVTVHVSGLSLLSKAFPEPRPWIEDRGDGTYLAQFVCATPGQYHINVHIDGALLSMCPATCDVTPGPASAVHCEVFGDGARVCQLGGHAEMSIKARDQYGNAAIQGGDRFGIRAIGHARLHQVDDNEDGTYTVCFSIPEFAHGDIALEVLLNGVPIKDSPVRINIVRPDGGLTADRVDEHDAPFHHEDHQARLRWLHEHLPVKVPDMPKMPEGVFGHTAYQDAAVLGQNTGDSASARMMQRAADEWRRLSLLRDEMERTRNALVDHQAALASASVAVQKQYMGMKERELRMHRGKEELEEVEARLHDLREELHPQVLPGGSTRGSPRVSPRGLPARARDAVTRNLEPGMWAVQNRVAFLHQGATEVLEEDRGKGAFGRAARGASPPRGDGGLSREFSAAPRYEARMLDAPPPPPLPPPEAHGAVAALGSPVSLVNSPGAARFSPHSQRAATPRGASAEELGQANRRLFRAFASCAIISPGVAGSPAGNALGRSGRMGLGLQDYLRLASAAQLRLPQRELEEAFQQTVKRYGGSSSARGERALAFELFVELLVETARKRYGDTSDAEGTAALFEEHLLPLARQLSSLESAGNQPIGRESVIYGH